MEPTSNKKILWIVIGIVVLALIIWWLVSPKPTVSPVINENTAATQVPGTADIGVQLQGLNDTDMNAELQDVTQDVSKL